MAPERRTVEVLADWRGLRGPMLVGQLHATSVRGKELFSFEYDAGWLAAGRGQSLDPGLRFHAGAQHPAKGRQSFGLFLDSSPDRWGRLLLRRREALLARAAGRAERSLTELDYLLGVFDGHRPGGLRFRIEGGPFLDDDAELASPPWTSLRELEQASLRLERAGDDAPAAGKWLRLLVAPGRSLGGARPKASVLDAKGALWIAKFPAASDDHDVGAWESVVHELASNAGVTTAPARKLRLGSRHHTFLSKRFDRTEDRARIHFASAMTLSEHRDGDEGASYLDLAGIVVQLGAHPGRDLEQLWRRMAFFVCVSNVDDHLRNHGFLLEQRGWALAPAYDMNPVATGDGLTLNLSETDNAQDLELLRSVARYFRVKGPRSVAILGEVTGAVRRWRLLAKAAGLSRAEQERMAGAFRLADGG